MEQPKTKRPLESPVKAHEAGLEGEPNVNKESEGGVQEPDSKKLRVDEDHEGMSPTNSPPTKKRLIKVIPPREPASSPVASFSSANKGRSSSPTITLKLNNHSEQIAQSSTTLSPKKTGLEENTAKGLKALDTTQSSSKEKEQEKLDSKNRMLAQMKFNCEKAEVLKMIEEARKQGKPVVVTDARLSNEGHPNYNVSLGHVVYTGAKSRSGHSNRASDLDLFLCPKFTPDHHFATIEVRIPSEYLSYRGNIAVRKSAVWGTDIYTDDSDIVAMIIHSGHYRPVDAPDAPDAHTAEGPPSSTSPRESSNVKFISPILQTVTPIVAKSDASVSSATTLVPDHDLHVTLRVLPRLIRYTGSNRYGLDSKGWGSLHDGESLQVVKVEKVERNSVSKQVRKTYFKGVSLENDRCFVFNSTGQTCFKYTPNIMVDWPAYLHAGIKENVTEKESQNAEMLKLPFRSEELKTMKDWPFWRVLLTRYKCVLHGDTIRYLVGGTKDLKILDAKERVLYSGIPVNSVHFNEEGLVFMHPEKIVVRFEGFTWNK